MMVTLIDLTRSTSHSLEYRPGPKPPTQNLQRHPWLVLTRTNCLMWRLHSSLTVTCHNGTLLGSCTDPIVNAMPSKQPPTSSALLGLPRVPKALLLQHTGVEELNIMVIGRLSRTSGFALMTSSTIWRAANARGYLIGLRYLMSSLFWVALIWHARRHFYYKMRDSHSKNVQLYHPGICSHCPTALKHLSLITLA